MNVVEEGIANADAGASEAWKAAALAVVEQVAKEQPELTTDDIWPRLNAITDSTHNGSALGPVMIRARQAGFISQTNLFRDSLRMGRNRGRGQYGKPVRLWKSNLFEVGRAA